MGEESLHFCIIVWGVTGGGLRIEKAGRGGVIQLNFRPSGRPFGRFVF